MPKSSFYKKYKGSADGEEECANAPRSGNPVSMHNMTSIEQVKLALCDNHRQSLRDITDKTGIN